MSFLAGRLASQESSYFLRESKQAVSKILEKQKNSANIVKSIAEDNQIPSPDVLPEILRHSLPSKIFSPPAENSGSSFSAASKWALKPDPKTEGGSGVSPDVKDPLRAYVSLPQATFGPKRWQLPDSGDAFLASTANDRRLHNNPPVNPEKLKAVAEGLTRIGSAFAIATTIVFGGAALIFGHLASKLEVRNNDDIRNKGKDLMQPKVEMFQEQLAPLRTRAEALSKKWHLEKKESVQQNPLIKELSKTLGAKTSA